MSELKSPHGAEFEQKITTEYAVFYNHETTPHNTPLTTWPLHITIAPPFELHTIDAEKSLVQLIREIAEEYEPFRVTAGKRDLFGPDKQGKRVEVTRIIDSASNTLQNLHERFLWDIGALGCSQMDGRWVLERYAPHVADQGGRRLNDTTLLVDALSLAKKSDDVRQILTTVHLVAN